MMELTRITDRRLTTAAVKTICSAFRRRGSPAEHIVGYRGGVNVKQRKVWIADTGVWFTYAPMKNRHWCAFGTFSGAKRVPITVELNPPVDGMDRRVAGLIASDRHRLLYLCHTGRIGGGRKGVSQKNFLSWYDAKRTPIIDPDGGLTKAFPLAVIESPRFVDQVSEYVLAVADFKAGKPALPIRESRSSFAGSILEFEGKKSMPSRLSYTAFCDHGVIRNCLAFAIRASGLSVRRDAARDLYTGDPAKPDVEFEIKTACDPQSLYTAVGQLLVHSAIQPAKRRVAVLPADLKKRRTRAIESLGIEIVTYRWARNQIHFEGLTSIVPKARNRAPVNPSKRGHA